MCMVIIIIIATTLDGRLILTATVNKMEFYIRHNSYPVLLLLFNFYFNNVIFIFTDTDVIACVDGTHIKIQAPSDHEADYINRKNYHSMNVQVNCLLQIMSVCVVSLILCFKCG